MHHTRRPAVLLLAFAAALALPGVSRAQVTPSLTEVVRETQKQSDTPGQLTMVWWLPEEFWTVSFAQEGAMSSAQAEAFLKTVRPYLLIAALDGKMGPLGGAEFVAEDVLRAAIKVRDARGNAYTPLPPEVLPGDLKNLSALLGAMFGNMLGPMGEGMHLFFFPATAADGTAIASAVRDGSFAVELSDQTFTWRLPLGSLLARKACPVDGERMSGAWKYCPWHGKELKAAPEAPAAAAPR